MSNSEKKGKAYNSKFAFWMVGCCMIIIVLTFVLDIFLIYGDSQENAVETFAPMGSNKDISTVEISKTGIQDSMQSVLLTNGLSLIAIAVTVWVGLNIYNNLKESEIEKKIHKQ